MGPRRARARPAHGRSTPVQWGRAGGSRRAVCAPLVALGVWLLLATGCATLPPPRKAPAELRVVATPETAIVYLNDRYLASARALAVQPIKLRPGKKLVTIKAPGHFPHDLALDLPSGETTVKIELRPVPR